jgi:hypothetical protein
MLLESGGRRGFVACKYFQAYAKPGPQVRQIPRPQLGTAIS